MPSEIRFLDDLRDDLMKAAWNQTLGRRHGRLRGGAPRRPGRLLAIAAAVTAFLTLAGGIGFLAMGGLGDQLGGIGGGGGGAVEEGRARPAEIEGGFEAAPPAPASDETLARLDYDSATVALGAAEQAAPGEGGAGGSGGPRSTGVRPPDDLSKIVRTAELSLVVENGSFKEAFADAVSVAERYGGYVENSNASGRAGSVRLRVPAGRFDAAIRDLRGLAIRVTGEQITGKEVTGQFVDLNARLDILRARRAVLFELMKDATTIDQTLRMQRELEDVQLSIEQIQGELKVLKNQVSKATIVVSMREQDAPEPVRGEIEKPSLFAAWDRAVAGFLGVLAAVVVGLGYLVPIAVIVAGLWLAYRRLRRPFA